MFKGILVAVLITSGYLFPSPQADLPQADNTLQESIKRGKAVYIANCQACHQAEGTGIPGAFPPLAKSDFLKDQKKVIGVLVHGLSGEITVNGQKYNMQMPAQTHLSDQQVADVLNYVQNNWGNKAEAVTPAQIAAARKKK